MLCSSYKSSRNTVCSHVFVWYNELGYLAQDIFPTQSKSNVYTDLSTTWMFQGPRSPCTNPLLCIDSTTCAKAHSNYFSCWISFFSIVQALMIHPSFPWQQHSAHHIVRQHLATVVQGDYQQEACRYLSHRIGQTWQKLLSLFGFKQPLYTYAHSSSYFEASYLNSRMARWSPYYCMSRSTQKWWLHEFSSWWRGGKE